MLRCAARAARTQNRTDKDGIAIILTDQADVRKYENLIGGQVNLESNLHHNLPEHINSEVGLGTITDAQTARSWLQNSFFYQRIQKNPAHYRLDKASSQSWTARVEELVTQSIQDLQDASLVAKEEDSDKLVSTEFGDIMSKVRPSSAFFATAS